jgi:hypothetical protein
MSKVMILKERWNSWLTKVRHVEEIDTASDREIVLAGNFDQILKLK